MILLLDKQLDIIINRTAYFFKTVQLCHTANQEHPCYFLLKDNFTYQVNSISL